MRAGRVCDVPRAPRRLSSAGRQSCGAIKRHHRVGHREPRLNNRRRPQFVSPIGVSGHQQSACTVTALSSKSSGATRVLVLDLLEPHTIERCHLPNTTSVSTGANLLTCRRDVPLPRRALILIGQPKACETDCLVVVPTVEHFGGVAEDLEVDTSADVQTKGARPYDRNCQDSSNAEETKRVVLAR
jgi:hypothetical protein